ncbi:hypothetical protein Bbelb_365650 [Branchiostoma belcheri]|nr:hypothetical protein Bbelb_365650 [Branchiostoma belcheri]
MVTVRLSGSQALSPAHPAGKTDCGGATPYWLGAAQLKAGGSCPMRCDDLSHRRKQPLAPYSTTIDGKADPTQLAPVESQYSWRARSSLPRTALDCQLTTHTLMVRETLQAGQTEGQSVGIGSTAPQSYLRGKGNFCVRAIFMASLCEAFPYSSN